MLLGILSIRMGASLNHVDQFLAIFDPPSPLVDWRGLLNDPPINYVDFSKTPPFTFENSRPKSVEWITEVTSSTYFMRKNTADEKYII